MPNDADIWTIKRLLNWTADFLKKKGAESPRLDAEVLLAHVLEWPRVSLYIHFEDEVGEKAKSAYRELVKKRSEGTPVAYLVGRKEFFSLPFLVSPSVLIPRPDTETAVVEALDFLKTRAHPRVADVGTGSGCIALAIAKHHETAHVTGIDISADALGVALKNAEILELSDRVRFLQGDLLAPILEEAPFDLIISNPPYIPTDDIEELELEVRLFEPHLALDGGAEGLVIVKRLVSDAIPRLKPGGCLLLEIGSAQEQAVGKILRDHPEFAHPITIRDAANLPRVIRVIRH